MSWRLRTKATPSTVSSAAMATVQQLTTASPSQRTAHSQVVAHRHRAVCRIFQSGVYGPFCFSDFGFFAATCSAHRRTAQGQARLDRSDCSALQSLGQSHRSGGAACRLGL